MLLHLKLAGDEEVAVNVFRVCEVRARSGLETDVKVDQGGSQCTYTTRKPMHRVCDEIEEIAKPSLRT